MAPLPSAEGIKVNWVNYKTGIPNISFKMDADNNTATISILLSHSDEGIQQLYFEQFLQLRRILEGTLQEEWTWQKPAMNEYGKPASRIYKQLADVNIHKKKIGLH